MKKVRVELLKKQKLIIPFYFLYIEKSDIVSFISLNSNNIKNITEPINLNYVDKLKIVKLLWNNTFLV